MDKLHNMLETNSDQEGLSPFRVAMSDTGVDTRKNTENQVPHAKAKVHICTNTPPALRSAQQVMIPADQLAHMRQQVSNKFAFH